MLTEDTYRGRDRRDEEGGRGKRKKKIWSADRLDERKNFCQNERSHSRQKCLEGAALLILDYGESHNDDEVTYTRFERPLHFTPLPRFLNSIWKISFDIS